MKSYRCPNSSDNSALYWQFFSFCSFLFVHIYPQNHLIVKVPPYENQTISSSVCVGIYVLTNAGRSHDVQSFTYTPDSGLFSPLMCEITPSGSLSILLTSCSLWIDMSRTTFGWQTGHHTKTLLHDCNRNLTALRFALRWDLNIIQSPFQCSSKCFLVPAHMVLVCSWPRRCLFSQSKMMFLWRRRRSLQSTLVHLMNKLKVLLYLVYCSHSVGHTDHLSLIGWYKVHYFNKTKLDFLAFVVLDDALMPSVLPLVKREDITPMEITNNLQASAVFKVIF